MAQIVLFQQLLEWKEVTKWSYGRPMLQEDTRVVGP